MNNTKKSNKKIMLMNFLLVTLNTIAVFVTAGTSSDGVKSIDIGNIFLRRECVT